MAIGRALMGAGAAMQGPSQTAIPGNGSPMMCVLTGQYVSGVNRICAYDCGGSAAARTVGAADLCPS